MKILVTGSKGFVGKNLVWTLKNIRDGKDRTFPISVGNIYEYDVDNTLDELKAYSKDVDFVVHLAGVNRPKDTKEFYEGNKGTIELLCECLKENKNKCPILISSSIQANKDNDYGKSKKQAEDYLKSFSEENGNKVYIYRFANIFGKWCRPNYNSVVATWCYNISHDLPIQVNNESAIIPFVYIDDVVSEIINAIIGNPSYDELDGYYKALPIYNVSLKELKDSLYDFYNQRSTLVIPDLSNEFTKKLYSTYLSYLPEDKIAISLNTKTDNRGSFTELLKTNNCGQFSVNVSKPGMVKGEHFHNTKWEFFIVVKGRALIEMRNVNDDKVIKFEVSDQNIKAIHMLPGYTHNIINLSDTEDLITLMWANEMFDEKKPDTFYEKVNKNNKLRDE